VKATASPEWQAATTRTPDALPASAGRSSSLWLSLGRDRRAPSRARAALRTFAEDASMAAAERATLALLISELVSNAVLHSDARERSDIVVQARLLEQGTIRVEVMDAGSGFNLVPRRSAELSPGGYGLLLVDEEASRWGVDGEGGTLVWFELDASTVAV
jgi:anti-sigma regulatory factor (Ser/Thr protein kinase)